MRVYVAGPITGKPCFNVAQFNQATSMLRAAGHNVFSPIENNSFRFHRDFTMLAQDYPDGDPNKLHKNWPDITAGLLLGDDAAYITNAAEAIAFLPGWETSNGSNAEWALGRALRLKIAYLPNKFEEMRLIAFEEMLRLWGWK